MERVGTLINKLKEQFEHAKDASELLFTTQMLLAELQQKQTSAITHRKVSVTMPCIMQNVEEPTINLNLVDEKLPNKNGNKKEEQSGWLFDSVVATPTLAHQESKEVFELNETVVRVEDESLNDKLKEEKIEVATVLQGTPVKDLKKAIGINDRYLFINELFRGDENMYERSIKTINSFNIYPEAEYWIQRELKVKLGWPENTTTVKHFDQLIKRRFS